MCTDFHSPGFRGVEGSSVTPKSQQNLLNHITEQLSRLPAQTESRELELGQAWGKAEHKAERKEQNGLAGATGPLAGEAHNVCE